MPLQNYSLLAGSVADFLVEKHLKSPHFEVKIKAKNIFYRISISVRSGVSPHELRYIVLPDIKHPIITKLKKLAPGMHNLVSKPNKLALDYIRSNLFDIKKMKTLPHTLPGPNNDLNELIEMYIKRAKTMDNSMVFAFGEKWLPANRADSFFHFTPAQGIHDIHMNQGSKGNWTKNNGVYQDGGLFIHLPDTDQWVGVFLAFQSQAIHTDDKNGNPIESTTLNEGLKIVAAMVNPSGKEAGNECITIMNVSNNKIGLSGWSVLDANKKEEHLPDVVIKPGDAFRYFLSGKRTRLSNSGGQITLLSPDKLKVDGVAYSRNQVNKQGWTFVP